MVFLYYFKLLKSIVIVNCIVILGIRYFNKGNEVSNVAVSRKSVSAKATGKPDSDEKLYKFRNPTLVRSQRRKITKLGKKLKNNTIFFLF